MIQSVSFPYGLKQIGSNAFSGCSCLKHLLLPGKSVPDWKGSIFRLYHFILYLYPSIYFHNFKGHAPQRPQIIRNSFSNKSRLLKIQADAFSECSALREISFPDSVQEIGNGSFYKCKNLSEVHFPENLKVISNQAFYSCGLTSLELPDSLEILDESAFSNVIT